MQGYLRKTLLSQECYPGRSWRNRHMSDTTLNTQTPLYVRELRSRCLSLRTIIKTGYPQDCNGKQIRKESKDESNWLVVSINYHHDQNLSLRPWKPQDSIKKVCNFPDSGSIKVGVINHSYHPRGCDRSKTLIAQIIPKVCNSQDSGDTTLKGKIEQNSAEHREADEINQTLNVETTCVKNKTV